MNEQESLANFSALWKKTKAKGDPVPVFHDLVERYSEPWRHYHDLSHISFGLELFQKTKLLAENPNAVEFAYWFHDAIYLPHRHDNEEQTAAYANIVMLTAQLPIEFRDFVIKLILATKHDSMATDDDLRLICDIDLAPLGLDPYQFSLNNQKIRQEYNFVPKEEYVRGRTMVLEGLLQRPSIYQTEFFRNHYERRAWDNIIVSIAWLPYSS